MYIDGYMERSKHGEILHVAERVNGKRVLKQLDPVYEYYVESPTGTVPTINGTYATKLEFSKFQDMKRSVESNIGKNIYESDCNVTFKTLAKTYMGSQSPDLNIVFFDIETDFHKKFGYAQPSDPFNRVTAISLYQNWTDKDYVLVMPPEEMPLVEAQDIINRINSETNNPNSIVILYTDEKEMFIDFFDLIDDCDIMSGWNSEFYDIPYMVNRTRILFGDAMTARFCLWNRKPTPREADMFGKTVVTYDLVGRVHLDSLALYKKHAGQIEQSYKLDYIGQKITKENKVAYDGSLDKLYRSDFATFVRYSKQDSILLKKIHEKLDHINLHNRLAHQQCVLISTTMGSVALIDTAIINLIHKRGEVVFNKKPQEADYDEYQDEDYDEDYVEGEEREEKSTAKAAGAWVQDPVLGLVDWLGCIDFNSLYPSVLRSLGMSTECILGQVRQTYTEKYLEDKINEQRRKSKSKKFEPKWAEAWHGLFASVEFTMVREKSTQELVVDLEDGSSFTTTGADLYDIIYGKDSTIVMSANGTLFDKNKNGVIPEILTLWYSERKKQQKMVIDFKHLATDGWELKQTEIESINRVLKTLDNPSSTMFKTNLHEDDPIYALREALSVNDFSTVASIINENGLVIKGNSIFCADSDKLYCKTQSSYWKQNQQIRKILLNSLYGALLNKGSRFYDKRLGQSVTLTGRSMAKHLASKINEVCVEKYDHSGGVVVYGDSVIGSSIIDVIINNEEQSISIEELYNMFSSTSYIDKGDKDYVNTNILVKTFNIEDNIAYYDNSKSIMRHKNNNTKYEISTNNHKCTITSDHSVMAEVDGEIGKFTPLEIKELLENGCDVYLIISK